MWVRVDVLPLLKFFWESGARPSVIFEHRHDNGEADTCKIHVSRIGDLFGSLLKDDLRISRYLPLLDRVFIDHVGGTEGMVQFKCPSSANTTPTTDGQIYLTCGTEEQRFSRGERGAAEFRKRPKATLLTLPYDILQHIYAMTITTGHTIKIDLSERHDRKAYLDAGLGFAYVDRHRWFQRKKFWTNGIVPKLTSHESRTSFQNFRPLLKWLGRADSMCMSSQGRVCPYCSDGATEPQLLRIDLHINAVKLRHARISVMDLIRTTAHAATDDDHRVFIRIILAGTAAAQGSSTSSDFFEMTLHDLRVATAKAVCTIITKHSGLLHSTCPEIFIDGYGRPVEYRFLGFDDIHRFNNLRGANRLKLRGLGQPYNGSIACYAGYLSAVRDGCSPDVAAAACMFLFCVD